MMKMTWPKTTNKGEKEHLVVFQHISRSIPLAAFDILTVSNKSSILYWLIVRIPQFSTFSISFDDIVHSQKSPKKQRDNTKTPPKTLHKDCGQTNDGHLR